MYPADALFRNRIHNLWVINGSSSSAGEAVNRLWGDRLVLIADRFYWRSSPHSSVTVITSSGILSDVIQLRLMVKCSFYLFDCLRSLTFSDRTIERLISLPIRFHNSVASQVLWRVSGTWTTTWMVPDKKDLPFDQQDTPPTVKQYLYHLII